MQITFDGLQRSWFGGVNIPALVALQQLVASSTHIVARSVAQAVPATTVVFYRGVFSVLTYAVWIWFVQRQGSAGTFQWRDWWRFALLGLVNMPLNQYLFVAGLRYTTAPNAALAFALSPVFVLVFASVLLKERLRWHAMIGIALAVLGAAIVAFQRGASLQSEVTVGNLMELAASCAWSFYTVWGRPLVQRYGAVPTTALGMLWGLVLFVPIAAFVPGGLMPPAAMSPRQWGEIAYLGIVTSGVGWALWYVLLRQMEASRLAVFNNLQPIVTVILSWIAFGELPPPAFWIGGAIALTGVLLAQRT
ncbi:MAG: hypothetical protein D6747_07730 [Chlorobiota bacterium]|nr:MAG: hypothetical protein D6747_07730 [Chlorobiota bacterium]